MNTTEHDLFDEFLPADNALLDSLNPSQRAAASHVEGPLLMLAGPGSGKTRVIIHRVANMIAQGVPSHQIVALTFTNKAADEMKVRLDELLDEHHAWTGTFHRFCSRLLRVYAPHVGLHENFTIYDHSDSKKVLKQVITTPRSRFRITQRIKSTIKSALRNPTPTCPSLGPKLPPAT